MEPCGAPGSGDEAGGRVLPVPQRSRNLSSLDQDSHANNIDLEPESSELNIFAAQGFLEGPYEVVFDECQIAEGQDDLEGNDSSGSGGRTEENDVDERFLLRNLDTGEMVDLRTGMPLPAEYVDPQTLAGKESWRTWKKDKRRQNERLWAAAEKGDLDQLRAVLAPGHGKVPPDLDSRSLDGWTALHLSAFTGHTKTARLLLDAGADPAARTQAEFTALHLACQRGHIDVVQELHAAQRGFDVCRQTQQGDTPLHLAAASGHTSIVAFLLEHSNGTKVQQVRNLLGQRPSEVCMNIDTATLFENNRDSFGGSVLRKDSKEDVSAEEDCYAGRTPFRGSVLLHNARADVVRKLLHKTSRPPPQHRDEEAETSPDASPAFRKQHVGSSAPSQEPSQKVVGRRQSFAQLRAEASTERVGPDSFQIRSLLGKGSFGEVYQVAHKGTGQPYAMKVLRKSRIMGRNLLRYAMTERNILSFIRHPYIVRLHYAFQTPSHLVLILQFCPHGNLQGIISREKRLREPAARLFTAQILLALEHLHERQIVFRDLKPDNIVIDEKGHAMLTDFGLSKEEVAGVKAAKSFCGSIAYLAPEILKRQGHGHSVDIYGLGVLLYEMLCGLPPFYHRDRDTLFRNIETSRLRVPAHVTAVASSLVQSLMQRDPAQRLGFEKTSDVRTHAFFEDMDWDKLLRREVPAPSVSMPQVAPDFVMPLATPQSPFERRGTSSKNKNTSGTHEVAGWDFSTPEPGIGGYPSQ